MSKNKLKILTLNTWGIPLMADIDTRVKALAEALATCDYDVVCLQEVWDKDNFIKIADGARSGGLIYQHHFRSGKFGSGLVTLSRYPIVNVNFHKFRLAGRIDTFWHGDYFAGKGIGLTQIDSPMGIIDVYNIHPIAQYHSDDRDEYKAHRATQHYEVTQFIAQQSNHNPIIAMGDFNMLDHQIGYRLITQLSQLRDCWHDAYPDEAGATFVKSNHYNRKKTLPTDERLDYIFINQHLKSNTVAITHTQIDGKNIPYSDHYGVAVDLTINESKDSDSEIDTAIIKPVLEELADVLAVGIMDAEYRQKSFKQHGKMSANAIIPLTFMGRLLNKSYSKWIFILLNIYSFMAWFIAEFNIGDEITQISTIADEVQHRINTMD